MTTPQSMEERFLKSLSERESKMYHYYKSVFVDGFEGGYPVEYDDALIELVRAEKELSKQEGWKSGFNVGATSKKLSGGTNNYQIQARGIFKDTCMTDLEIIRAACVKVKFPNPHLEDRYLKELQETETFRLADVLLAIKEAEYNYLVSPFGEFWKIVNGGNPAYEIEFCKVYWNLRNDDLSQQSPETLAFLANLLKTLV